jgi:hypothetical protein
MGFRNYLVTKGTPRARSRRGSSLTLGKNFMNLKSGCWTYEEDKMQLSFFPEIEQLHSYAIYGIPLSAITTSAKLLDSILQLQRKGKWSQKGEEARNFYGKWKCDDYDVWGFIELVDLICRLYMKTGIQGVFSPRGEERSIDWDRLRSERKE